jgi:uncharacterized membrane protein
MSHKTLTYLFLAVVVLGLGDALYLSMTVLLDIPPTCGILHGCETVSKSAYSRVLGIPLAYLAAAYFLGASIIGGFIAESRRWQKFAVAYGAAGVAVALWSLYLMQFVIHAWCIYCLGIDLALIFVFLISLMLLRKNSPQS